MGKNYIDFDTMMQLKKKFLDVDHYLLGMKANKKNVTIPTRLNIKAITTSESPEHAPLFKSAIPMRIDAKYNFLLGNKDGHYLMNKGNGNGYVVDKNDYVHQRKYYLEMDDEIYHDSIHRNVTLSQFCDFFFNYDISGDEIVTRKSCQDEFDYINEHSSTIRIKANRSVDWFLEYAGSFIIEFKRCKKETTMVDSQKVCSLYACRGRIYIAKNAQERAYGGYYCEEIIGYLHLMIRLVRIDDDWCYIYLSRMSDK